MYPRQFKSASLQWAAELLDLGAQASESKTTHEDVKHSTLNMPHKVNVHQKPAYLAKAPKLLHHVQSGTMHPLVYM